MDVCQIFKRGEIKMGTRNLTVVVFGGVVRVAQYGQWDGYPSGNGVKILDFLRNRMNSIFFSRLLRTKFISDEEIKTKWKSAGADDSGWVGMNVSEKFKETNYQLSRDCGASVLEFIQNSDAEVIELDDSFVFGGDSLFCEWAYVLDLDNNTLEVYRGFNEKTLGGVGRFAHLETVGENYKPIKLIKKYDLSELPQKRDFVRELEKLTKE